MWQISFIKERLMPQKYCFSKCLHWRIISKHTKAGINAGLKPPFFARFGRNRTRVALCSGQHRAPHQTTVSSQFLSTTQFRHRMIDASLNCQICAVRGLGRFIRYFSFRQRGNTPVVELKLLRGFASRQQCRSFTSHSWGGDWRAWLVPGRTLCWQLFSFLPIVAHCPS